MRRIAGNGSRQVRRNGPELAVVPDQVLAVSGPVSASKYGLPVTISNSTTPTDQRSLARSTSPVFRRSGDEYCELPNWFCVNCPGQRQRLGDAEIEDPYLAVGRDADIARLDVAVNDAAVLVPIDGRVEVWACPRVSHRSRPMRAANGMPSGPVREHFGQVLSIDILHLDVEVVF